MRVPHRRRPSECRWLLAIGCLDSRGAGEPDREAVPILVEGERRAVDIRRELRQYAAREQGRREGGPVDAIGARRQKEAGGGAGRAVGERGDESPVGTELRY